MRLVPERSQATERAEYIRQYQRRWRNNKYRHDPDFREQVKEKATRKRTEVEQYLDHLLTHPCQGSEPCRDCHALDVVCELLEAVLFSTVIYPVAFDQRREQAARLRANVNKSAP